MTAIKSALLSVAFWIAAGERAVKTFAQTAIATIGVGATDLLSVAWGDVFAVSGLAAVLSILTSIVSAPVGATKDDPSLI